MSPVKSIVGFHTGYTLDEGITHSLLSDFCACQERVFLQLQGWESADEKRSLWLGTMIHEIAALRIQEYISGESQQALIEYTFWRWYKQYEKDQKALVDIARVEAVMRAYFRFWEKSDREDYEWLQSEAIFDLPPSTIPRLRGRRDAVLREKRTGTVGILETKSFSRMDSDKFTLGVDVSPQHPLYMETAERELGIPVRWVLYNGIRVPGQVWKGGEPLGEFRDRITDDIRKRPEHYFVRFPIIHTPERRDAFKKQLVRKVSALRRFLKNPASRYRNEQACLGGGWKCEFLEACASNSMAGYLRTRRVHRELE